MRQGRVTWGGGCQPRPRGGRNGVGLSQGAGVRRVDALHADLLGATPARGTTPRPSPTSSTSRVQPRSRGDHSSVVKEIRPPSGPTPHARGPPGWSLHRDPAAGTNPARAGTTLPDQQDYGVRGLVSASFADADIRPIYPRSAVGSHPILRTDREPGRAKRLPSPQASLSAALCRAMAPRGGRAAGTRHQADGGCGRTGCMGKVEGGRWVGCSSEHSLPGATAVRRESVGCAPMRRLRRSKCARSPAAPGRPAQPT